ncbi:restriction endonuclease [Streptomyces sp. B93]|uniref:restriction endonuclease n=1 Tax=Streptomyces sp. B93 TaxID=2824875 RepID=UPI001B35DF90|nr:restriction endonuclease [Streptomyces sp. B93]MBQ1089261.1 restriction endonuclease [Streptomyces sp. B93]
MTPPVHPTGRKRERRFSLRVTTAFFVLLALLVVLTGTVARAVARAFDHRPEWILALAGVGVAVLLRWAHRRRRLSAARLAREATETLERAARTTVDALDAPPVRDGRGIGVAEEPCLTVDEEPCPAEDPAEFEAEIAALCRRDGCTDVEVVGGAGDLGADVVASTPDGRRLVVQCKWYGDGNKVGSQDLQRFGGTCFAVHGADLALVVTTSGFTLPALEYAEQCGIVCVDEEALHAWVTGTAPSPWQEVPAG